MASANDLARQDDELDRPGIYLEEDRPNVLVRLVWRGRPPAAGWRWAGATTAVVAMAGLIAGAIYASRLLCNNVEQIGEIVMLGAGTVWGLYLLYVAAGLLGRLGGYWRELVWDGVEGEFRAERRGWLWWGRRTVSIPLDSIVSLSFDQGAEGRGPVPLSLRISYRDAGGSYGLFKEPLALPRVFRRRQGKLLFFSIGRILQADGYMMPVDDLRTQQLVLRTKRAALLDDDDEDDDDGDDESDSDVGAKADQSGRGGSKFRPIPPPGDADEFELGEPAAPPRKRAARSSGFDPEAVNKRLEFTRIEEWQPGRQVRILRSPPPGWVLWMLELIAVGLSALAGAYPLWFVAAGFVGGDPAARWVTIALAAFAGWLLAAILIYNNFREREVSFDWLRGELSERVGAAVCHWPLGEIQGLVFAQQRSGDSGNRSAPGGGPPQWECRLDLILPDRDVLALKNERMANHSADACRAIESLGAELAAALGTACTSAPFDRTADLRETFRLSLPQKLMLSALGMIAVALLGWGAIHERKASHVAEQVGALSVTIHRMGSFARNDDVICEHYWNVEVKDAAVLAAHGDEIRALLPGLPKVGFDAGESNVSDNELAVFRGAKLWLADVSQTQVTDAGIALLAECDELMYLDAYDAPIGDAALAALSRLPRLRYLYLPGTRVTDAGLKSLYAVSTLRVVHLGGCPVTPEGVAALRKALPDAQVIH